MLQPEALSSLQSVIAIIERQLLVVGRRILLKPHLCLSPLAVFVHGMCLCIFVSLCLSALAVLVHRMPLHFGLFVLPQTF